MSAWSGEELADIHLSAGARLPLTSSDRPSDSQSNMGRAREVDFRLRRLTSRTPTAIWNAPGRIGTRSFERRANPVLETADADACTRGRELRDVAVAAKAEVLAPELARERSGRRTGCPGRSR